MRAAHFGSDAKCAARGRRGSQTGCEATLEV